MPDLEIPGDASLGQEYIVDFDQYDSRSVLFNHSGGEDIIYTFTYSGVTVVSAIMR